MDSALSWGFDSLKFGLAIGKDMEISLSDGFEIITLFEFVLWDVFDNESVLLVISDEWEDVDKFDEYVNDDRSFEAVLYELPCLE